MEIRINRREPIGRVLRLIGAGVFSPNQFAQLVTDWKPLGAYRVNIDDLPFGLYALMVDGRDDASAVALYSEAVGRPYTDIGLMPTGDFLDILHCLRADLERAAKAFAAIPQPTLTADETAAGFGALNFGLFGIVDTLACRQGLTDEQVKQMSVATVIGKLNIIGQRAAAERRLQEILKRKRG